MAKGEIIYITSARNYNETARVAVNLAAALAESRKVLLVEWNPENPTYASCYSNEQSKNPLFNFDEKKNQYAWLNNRFNYKIEKHERMNEFSQIDADYRRTLIEEVKKSRWFGNPKDDDSAMRMIETFIDSRIKEKVSYKIKEYIQRTNYRNFDIFAGKKNQNDSLKGDKLKEIMSCLLYDETIKELINLKDEYDRIIIDSGKSDFFADSLLEISDKKLVIAENAKASFDSVYYNIYYDVDRIFKSRLQKDSSVELIAHYNINTEKKNWEIYDEMILKAKECLEKIRLYEHKGEYVAGMVETEEEKEIFDKFGKYKKDIEKIIEESENKRRWMTFGAIVNNVQPEEDKIDFAVHNFNHRKDALKGYGIMILNPGLGRKSGGIIYSNKNLEFMEDIRSNAMLSIEPKSIFSIQIKKLAEFIDSDWSR